MENKNIENNKQMDTYDKILPEAGNGGLSVKAVWTKCRDQ